jgi:hypothetical protein
MYRPRRLHALFLPLCLSFAACPPLACGPGARTYPTVPLECPQEPILETVTVNWGLAPGVVRHASPRIPAVADEIRTLRLGRMGIACFQEVWTDEARDAVVEALALPPENVYVFDTRGENERTGIDVCAPGELDDVEACVRSHCTGLPDEEQTICALDHCKTDLGLMYYAGAKECFNCVAASVGLPVDGIVARCVQPDVHSTVQGASRAFGGRNGVVLASRWPLKRREAIRLRSSYSNRVALLATIEVPGFGPIEVACTHVSTWNELPPNHPEFSDWDDEMKAQIEDVSERLAERAGGVRPQLFLGDMNAGPRIAPDVSEAMGKVWSRIVSLGFFSPAAHVTEPFCSTCEGNSLRAADARSYLIDHVLLRDPKGGPELVPVCAHPFLDQSRVYEGYGGQLVDGHLSDHYGINVDFRLQGPGP